MALLLRVITIWLIFTVLSVIGSCGSMIPDCGGDPPIQVSSYISDMVHFNGSDSTFSTLEEMPVRYNELGILIDFETESYRVKAEAETMYPNGFFTPVYACSPLPPEMLTRTDSIRIYSDAAYSESLNTDADLSSLFALGVIMDWERKVYQVFPATYTDDMWDNPMESFGWEFILFPVVAPGKELENVSFTIEMYLSGSGLDKIEFTTTPVSISP